MFHAGQDLPFGGCIAFQLIGHNHPWHVRQPFEELAEELLRGGRVAPALHQDIEHMAVLIHRPPEIVAFSANR
jgi:hypothetical protein